MRFLLTHTEEARALQFGARALAALSEHGEVVLNQGAVLRGRALVDAAQGCDLIVADRRTALPAEVFRETPGLLAVLRCAVDIRNIDVAAASEAGVLVTRAIPCFAVSVAELALGLMLDTARGISRAAVAYAAGDAPQISMGRQLRGETLGIVGYGAIGRELATMARGLGMQVLVTTPERFAPQEGITPAPLEVLLAQSGFVACLASVTPETTGMFGAEAFAAMRRDAVFLNLARAELVDEAALAQALDKGEIAGAALDVGSAPDQRPPPVLAARPDVVATPHVGGQTPEAIEGQALHVARQVAALAAGQMPPDAVNPEDAQRLRRWFERHPAAGSPRA
ncbi:MAG: hydroxyacid dehydrogenase [Rhodobacteraceae bacterium]|nr:MAG: hydroxyacid dehydrogenase [Paracoccaceae bacterium]